MGKFTKGLLFGSIVGGISGLFFAPRSGKETRQLIVDEVEDAVDKKNAFDESLTQFKDSLIAFQEAVDIFVDPFIDGITKDVNDFQFQAEPRIAQIEQQIKVIQAELPDIPMDDR